MTTAGFVRYTTTLALSPLWGVVEIFVAFFFGDRSHGAQPRAPRCFGRADWGQVGSGNATNNVGDNANEMGDNLPIVRLVAPGANYTASMMAAHNGPCAVMQSDVAVSVALKCWGPNGYGSLGVVSEVYSFAGKRLYITLETPLI